MDEKSSPSRSRAAFQSHSFRHFMAARFLTTISSEMQSVAVGWQVYELTHRPLDLGIVGLAQFLPGICLFLLAGHTADRVPRLRIIRTCYAGFAGCSVSLLTFAAHGLRSAWPIYAVLVLNGVVRAFNAPASQAFVPVLVAAEDFPNAIAWSSSIFQTATVAGPMIGGILYGLTGSPVYVYLSAFVCYSCAFVIAGRITIKQSAGARPVAASTRILFEGLSFIWRQKLILGAVSLDLFAVLLGGSVALLPVFAREILHIGATGLGVLRSAPGVGAVMMGIIIAHWPLQTRAGIAMLSCVGGFGVFTIVFGLSHNVVLSLVMLLLAGAADTVSVVVRHTLIQLSTPDEMRGRVSAVNTVFIGASNEVGQFESGLTAQWFGAVPAVVLGGIGTLAVVLAWGLLFPGLRRLDRLLPATERIDSESADVRV